MFQLSFGASYREGWGWIGSSEVGRALAWCQWRTLGPCRAINTVSPKNLFLDNRMGYIWKIVHIWSEGGQKSHWMCIFACSVHLMRHNMKALLPACSDFTLSVNAGYTPHGTEWWTLYIWPLTHQVSGASLMLPVLDILSLEEKCCICKNRNKYGSVFCVQHILSIFLTVFNNSESLIFSRQCDCSSSENLKAFQKD